MVARPEPLFAPLTLLSVHGTFRTKVSPKMYVDFSPLAMPQLNKPTFPDSVLLTVPKAMVGADLVSQRC